MLGNVWKCKSDGTGAKRHRASSSKNALGNVRLLREASEPMQIMAHFERRRAGNAARAQASPYSKARSRSYPMGIQSIAFRRRMRPHKRRVIKKRDKQRTRIRPVRTQTDKLARFHRTECWWTIKKRPFSASPEKAGTRTFRPEDLRTRSHKGFYGGSA